jgi:hypothetical protein
MAPKIKYSLTLFFFIFPYFWSLAIFTILDPIFGSQSGFVFAIAYFGVNLMATALFTRCAIMLPLEGKILRRLLITCGILINTFPVWFFLYLTFTFFGSAP